VLLRSASVLLRSASTQLNAAPATSELDVILPLSRI
jgi:hypothetical protein